MATAAIPSGLQRLQIRCNSHPSSFYAITAEQANIAVAQCFVRDGHSQLFETVLVRSRIEADGSPSLGVFLCDPNWDEPRQIVRIFTQVAGTEHFTWEFNKANFL